ncbi:metallophosphoesterase [Dysgonomonas mossii]|uniref:Calcineurin-like phosphoesterase domain-containing protein n=1 Tax=Dysgonomonas mossii TaxID=163665 RepID=A0A4Y9ILZ1_9BACT|nr:metallophosphoesterase [Dysgonomonas mossii]MBF0761696.1 metallophosphoesterase [Dysgonomonas mossii]TFU89332.1 hypothetical protein E4T88_11630 [Dysgonomonas mossii]
MTKTNISFLHLTDLHIGDKLQKGLISQVSKVLLDDIDYILKKMSSLDVVFFTGDLVQRGSSEEYLLLEDFLKKMWNLFSKHGYNPYLLCVPGNHDLERINDPKDATHKVLCNWIKEDIRGGYFWEEPNQYYTFIEERFKNYTDWYNNTSIRKPDNLQWGYIPGDFCTSININGINLGVVGLNSAFLQLDGGNFKNRLGIYNDQIYSLFGDNYLEWLAEHNVSVLLTHHSPDWYEQNAIDEYKNEIYISDSFLEHLCGHMHEPSYSTISLNGFPSKRHFISPSLFGLETYGENISRIHGYTAGTYSFESGSITKTIWPRKSVFTQNGGLKISQNEEFNLDKDTASLTEFIASASSDKIEENSLSVLDLEKKSGNLFSEKTFVNSNLARTIYKENHSHIAIRLHDRNKAITHLTQYRHCWITTEFGLGEDEFIGSLLSKANIYHGNCFSINCDEATTIDGLMDCFSKTFSQNITKFFDIVNSLDRPLIVFNKISDELVENAAGLKEFSKTIFDFSPDVRVIFISNTIPDNRFFECIRLLPLDTPAIKQYVESSQEIQGSFSFLDYEKIYRISSGIPFYVDKVIEQLTFRPLSDLGDMELLISSDEDPDYILSATVKNEINLLSEDDSKQGSRRFSMLTIISLLHNGETFDRIRRFDPTKPFYPDDIAYLLKNKLIETIQVNTIFDNNYSDSEVIKIIKVPRLIRDYITSLITEDEKIDIYKTACNLYLGTDWRSTIKFIQSKDAELDLIIYQNLQIAIRSILQYGIKCGNDLEISRMARISLALIEDFTQKGAYKDAVSLTEETLLLIKDVNNDEFDVIRTYLIKNLGENLRMTSLHDRSISILKSLCDDENNSLSKNDRNDIRLSIAYAYKSKRNEEEALRYANLIKKNESKKNSSLYLSAEYVIINFIHDKIERISKLKALKAKAEKHHFQTLKANIILELCRIEKDENQIKLLDKIITESKNDIYNKVRALVTKTDIVLKSKNVDEITLEDLLGLDIAYSYTFYQRLVTLLNKCHNLAWEYWSKRNGFDQLLNLFRYSSFVWRLCNSPEEELIYLNKLYENPDFREWLEKNREGVNSAYYEQRIFALYNNDKALLPSL